MSVLIDNITDADERKTYGSGTALTRRDDRLILRAKNSVKPNSVPGWLPFRFNYFFGRAPQNDNPILEPKSRFVDNFRKIRYNDAVAARTIFELPSFFFLSQFLPATVDNV